MSQELPIYLEPSYASGGFDAIAGRTSLKQLLMGVLPGPYTENLPPLPRVNGLSLVGPPGSGRHALLQALCWELEQYGWQVYTMDASLLTIGEIPALLEFLGDLPCCLLVENPQDSPSALVCLFREASRKGITLLALTAEDPAGPLAPALKRHFLPCQVSLPSSEDRIQYLLQKLGQYATDDLFDLVVLMEGWTYVQLAAFVSHYLCCLRQAIRTGGQAAALKESQLLALKELCTAPVSGGGSAPEIEPSPGPTPPPDPNIWLNTPLNIAETTIPGVDLSGYDL